MISSAEPEPLRREIHEGLCVVESWNSANGFIYYGKGAIEAIGVPSSVAACHCQSCRKHTGAPAAVFVDYLESQVHFTKARPTLYESSIGVRRGFCEICGSTISYQADNLPDMVHLHIGVFDAPQKFTPSANEKTEAKLPWLCVSTVRVDSDES